jgi:hypothetical protein
MSNNVTEFKSFIDDLPATCVFDVRISDNVLEESDWGIDQVYIQDGVVMFQDTIFKGVYTIPNMIGWTSKQLMEWSRHDSTGSHPETYYEIKVYKF